LVKTAWWVLARRKGFADSAPEWVPALFGAVTLGFFTAAIPILVGREWLTISWALELGALCWLYQRRPHRGLLHAIALLGVGVSVRLLINPALWSYYPRSGMPVLNFYLYTFGVPAVAFLAGAQWLENAIAGQRAAIPSGAPVEGGPHTSRLRLLLRIAAVVFVFFLVNVQVADYFSQGETLTFHLRGASLTEDMTYSLAWGGFALCLLALGIARDKLGLRIGALAVLTLTLVKVTLHDLWELGGLYRVGSLIGVAFALLLVSFLTQRLVLRKPVVQ